MSGKITGYVYIMRSESSAHLKIGHTHRSISERESELFQTGMPEPLTAVYHICVESPNEIESAVHKELDLNRVSQNREFFNCSLDCAITTIRRVCSAQNRNILAEWVSNSTSLEVQGATPQWPPKAQEFVASIEADIDKKIRVIGSQWKTLLRNVPRVEAGNFENLADYIEWRTAFHAIWKIYESASVDRILAVRPEIKYFCGALPENAFEQLLSATWSRTYRKVFGILAAHEDYQKVIAFSREFKSIEELVSTRTKEVFEADCRIQELHQNFEKIDNHLLLAEKFYVSPLPDLNERNRTPLKKWLNDFEEFKYSALKREIWLRINDISDELNRLLKGGEGDGFDHCEPPCYDEFDIERLPSELDENGEEPPGCWFNVDIERYAITTFARYALHVNSRLTALCSMEPNLEFVRASRYLRFGPDA